MSGSLNDLYHPTILEHNKHPTHFEKWEDAPHTIEAYNPVCGDQFKLFLEIENGRIRKVTFHGYGCALSKAATSVLVQLLQGKSLNSARQTCEQFQEALGNGISNPAGPPEFDVFLAVKKFPGRLQCVTLSSEALKKFLDDVADRA